MAATVQIKLLEAGERAFRLALPVFIPAQTVSILESRARYESLPRPDVPSELAERSVASGQLRVADGYPCAS